MNERQMDQRANEAITASAIAPGAGRRHPGRAKLRRPVVVFFTHDHRAWKEARRLARAGAMLLPLDVGTPYPEQPGIRTARREYESRFGLVGALVEPADACDLLAEADGITMIVSVWNGLMAAPLTAFLDAHRDRSRAIEFMVLAREHEVDPSFQRRIAEHLAAGTRAHVSFLATGAPAGALIWETDEFSLLDRGLAA